MHIPHPHHSHSCRNATLTSKGLCRYIYPVQSAILQVRSFRWRLLSDWSIGNLTLAVVPDIPTQRQEKRSPHLSADFQLHNIILSLKARLNLFVIIKTDLANSGRVVLSSYASCHVRFRVVVLLTGHPLVKA